MNTDSAEASVHQPSPDQPKAAFRAWARAKLKHLSLDREVSESAKACKRALALLERIVSKPQAATSPPTSPVFQRDHEAIVLGYASIRGEIDPIMLLQWCIKQDAAVAMPFCHTRQGTPSLVALPSTAIEGVGESAHFKVSEFAADAWGIPVPRMPRPVRAADVVAVLVPGLVFDRTGQRLGRGAGIYDRLLAALPPNAIRIGLVHGDRLIDRLPREAHDIPMHHVVTSQEVVTVAQ